MSPVRKPFVRQDASHVRTWRLASQLAFLLLNLWIGIEFYLFVRHVETGGQTLLVQRPPGVEGWLPIAGLMNLKYTLATWRMPDVHPAGMVLLAIFLVISWLLRKAFCSWLCPVGTVSEWLWRGGSEIFGRNLSLPKWADIPLRGVKYLLLAFFGYAVLRMSAADVQAFMQSPYGVVADVKMLNFFRHLGTTAALVIVALVGLSVVVKNFWCRYACPYGALVGLASLASPARISRDPQTCIDCAKCARACPSRLPVDRKIAVRSAECTGCLDCVAACPVKGALALAVPARRVVPAWAVFAIIAALFLGGVGAARLAGHWRGGVPTELYFELVPAADGVGHPGM